MNRCSRILRMVMACLALALAVALGAGPVLAETCDLNRPRLSPRENRVLHEVYPLLEKGNDREALKLLKPLTAEENPHHQVLFMMGLVQQRLERKKEAEACYRRALAAKPCFHSARYNLAVALAEQKKTLEAAGEMLKVYRDNDKPDPDHLYQAALLYLQSEKGKTALKLLEELTAGPKPKISWLEALAHTYLMLKETAKAEQVAHRILAVKPELERAWRLAAQAAMMQRQYAKAAARLRVAVELKCRGASDWRSLGDLYRASGAPAKAVDCYRLAMGDKPDVKDYDRIAQTWAAAQRPDMALEAAEKAVKLEPSARRWALVGEIHMAEHRYKQAEKAYAQAAQREDKDGRYSLRRGYAAWQTMDLGVARRAFTQALDKAPKKSSTAKQALSALQGIAQAEAALAAERASRKASM